MSGTTEVKRPAKIYLDSNVFVEAIEGRILNQLLTAFMLDELDKARQRFVTSELTLSELLVKPLEVGRHDLVQVYDNWTISNPAIEVVPVVREVLRDAAELRSRDKSLKLPDAIDLMTAVGTRCQYFLTGDKRISGQFGVRVLLLTRDNILMLQKEDADGTR